MMYFILQYDVFHIAKLFFFYCSMMYSVTITYHSLPTINSGLYVLCNDMAPCSEFDTPSKSLVTKANWVTHREHLYEGNQSHSGCC